MQGDFQARVRAAAASARKNGALSPRVGVILGSGLSDLVDQLLPEESGRLAISYKHIEGFGAPSVTGHRGTLYVTPDAAVMAGRYHFYEGKSMDDVVLPVATLCSLGIRTLIVTNAAGGLNPDYVSGNLVLIKDHINLMGTNPLIGPKDPESIARFQDMTEAYSSRLRETAMGLDAGLKEGVYAALTGPSYETPAEIRMLGAIGADLVGMSTVPEVIVARSYGVEVLGISTVTNLAAGMSGKVLDHSEVVEVGRSIQGRMTALVTGLLKHLVN
jgi:purine-nucleoside phosphorylase